MDVCTWILEIIRLAELGPTGRALRGPKELLAKIESERQELLEAIATGNVAGTLEELGDCFGYYEGLALFNGLKWANDDNSFELLKKATAVLRARYPRLDAVAAHQLARKVAVAKYTERFVRNKGRKDKAAEYAAILAAGDAWYRTVYQEEPNV